MGLTIIEAMKHERRLEVLAVMKTFAEGELLRRVPFLNIAGGGVFFGVEKKLPQSNFRALNEGYVRSQGVIEPASEAVYPFGGDVDVDRATVDLQGAEVRASRTEMQVRSMRLNLEASIINGDAVANGLRGFDGLARRIRPGDRMAIANGSGPLNVDRVDALIDSVNSFGQPKYLLCSKPVRRQLNRAAREATGTGIHRDGGAFYNDTEVLTVDQDADGHEVMGYDEAGGTSSLYCITFGDEAATGLQGQFDGRYGISVRDLGEVSDAPVFRTRVDWYIGFACKHPRCVGRLHGIQPPT